MKRTELDGLSTDDLWSLHIELSQLLQQRIQQEKLQLEERLKLLTAPVSRRRPYPPVPPKYRNPDRPSETWAGRGKRPRWLLMPLHWTCCRPISALGPIFARRRYFERKEQSGKFCSQAKKLLVLSP